MGPANLPDRAASSGEADEDRLVDLDVQEESAAVRCGVTAALVRDGRKPRALWVSTFDRFVASGRLDSERETHHRLYTEEQLIVRTKQRRKIARRQRGVMAIATAPDHCWSMDFMSDKFADGRSFRILTVVDQFTRECVCLEADRAMTGMKVAQALEQAKAERGRLPGSITVDNGSEFSSRALEAWVMGNDVQLYFIRPGRPVENGFIESLNGRLRDECLNVEWFVSLQDARQKLAKFREHYNHERPHSALADRTPAAFAELQRRVTEKTSTLMGAKPA